MLSDEIKALRKSLRLTQAEFGEKVNRKQSAIQVYERRGVPSEVVESCQRLADEIGATARAERFRVELRRREGEQALPPEPEPTIDLAVLIRAVESMAASAAAIHSAADRLERQALKRGGR